MAAELRTITTKDRISMRDVATLKSLAEDWRG
jgi:hypothetical protein